MLQSKVSVKYSEENSVSGEVSYQHVFIFFRLGGERGWGGGGRLFKAGRLLFFSAFRMGAYLRWALIRDWAPIPINTVSLSNVHFFSTSVSQKRKIIDCEEIPAVNSGTPNSVVTTLTNIENIIRRTYWYAITEETVWRLLRKNRVRQRGKMKTKRRKKKNLFTTEPLSLSPKQHLCQLMHQGYVSIY